MKLTPHMMFTWHVSDNQKYYDFGNTAGIILFQDYTSGMT